MRYFLAHLGVHHTVGFSHRMTSLGEKEVVSCRSRPCCNFDAMGPSGDRNVFFCFPEEDDVGYSASQRGIAV